MKTINVTDVLESRIAVSPQKGTMILSKLSESIRDNEVVELDFEGVKDLTTAFLNVAIGDLYKEFSSEQLTNCLILKNINDLDSYLIKEVIHRVRNKEQKETASFSDILVEELGDE